MNKLTLIVFSLPFLSACSPSMPELPDLPNFPNMSDIIPEISMLTPYEADVHQGSILERFRINQLKIGMSKAQVQDLIGSPSVVDPFHNNQWNYINHSTLHKKDNLHYHLVLSFEGGMLSNINADGIGSLAQLTAAEKTLEEKRIVEEKAKAEAEAVIEAEVEAERIAKEKAVKKAKALEEKRIVEEKAKDEAAAESKRLKEENKPWYKF